VRAFVLKASPPVVFTPDGLFPLRFRSSPSLPLKMTCRSTCSVFSSPHRWRLETLFFRAPRLVVSFFFLFSAKLRQGRSGVERARFQASPFVYSALPLPCLLDPAGRFCPFFFRPPLSEWSDEDGARPGQVSPVPLFGSRGVLFFLLPAAHGLTITPSFIAFFSLQTF